jgi:hypothetical protein
MSTPGAGTSRRSFLRAAGTGLVVSTGAVAPALTFPAAAAGERVTHTVSGGPTVALTNPAFVRTD